MNGRIVFGVIYLALGFALIAVPAWLLPTCSGGLAVPEASGPEPVKIMKCLWTARMVAALGAAAMLGGLGRMFCKTPGAGAGVAGMTLPLAALAALAPTWLIGVCPFAKMACRLGTLPGVVVAAALLFAAAAVDFLLAARRRA